MSSSPRSGPDHGSEQLAVVVLAAAGVGALFCGVAWLAGQLTLLAAGDGWTPAPVTRSPTLLAGLLHGHHPAQAWGAAYPAAPAMPASGGYWTTAGLLSLTAVVVV